MRMRHELRVVVPLSVLALLSFVPGSLVARFEGDDRTSPAMSTDEQAIRKLDESFIRDYEQGDSKALAGLFVEDAEVIEADGSRYRGRAPIEESFSETFAASPGSKIAFEIDSIRFLSPNIAQEDGRAIVTPVRGAPRATVYTVLYVKHDDRWLITSVREDLDPLTSPGDRLKDLEWMVGDWVDEGSDSEVRVHCDWSEDKNYLIRTYTVQERGKPVMTVTQRIGWDPLARQVRSWEFDSRGGFGEGRWGRAGDHWVIKHTAVQPEGTPVSATNILDLVKDNHIRWTSVDRVVGGEALPDDQSHSLVRVPPPPPGSIVDPKTSTNPSGRPQ